MNLKRLAKRALATLSLSMLCLIAFAQGHQISGTVIDGTGEPIIGANVLEVGTTNGVITDIDGNFKLSVQPNAKNPGIIYRLYHANRYSGQPKEH